MENYEKYIGLDLSYGDSFQLLHNLTGMYLGFDLPEDGKMDKARYSIGLYQVAGDKTTFKVKPSKEYQKDSNGHVFYYEPIYISEMYSLSEITYYLHCQAEKEKVTKILGAKYTGMIPNLKKGK